MEGQVFSILATVAAGLMVVVTGGVIYLTAAEWRDRRRRKQEESPRISNKVSKARPRKASKR